MKRLVANLFIVTLFVFSATSASAGFFDKLASGFGGADIDVLFNYVTTADTTFKKSIDILFAVLASEEDKVKIEMELKAANEIKDPKEKEAKIKAIDVEKQAAVKKASNQQDCKNKCAALDDKKKGLYANAVYNLLLAGIYDLYAVQQGTAITQKCSANPTSCAGITLKLNTLSGILLTLPAQAKNITDLGSTLTKIASASNIEIQQPKSEKDKPKEVAI